MKRENGVKLALLFIIIATVISALTVFTVSAERSEVSAKSAALYEPSSKRFLYSKNTDVRLPMASTTKIMTALVAAESVPLDGIVSIPAAAVGTEGSSAYFKEGEQLTVKALLYAVLLQSANDASVALAHYVSGSTEGFALKMNERAKSLGLHDTNFVNPHGLHDEEHYTTAHDLAIITAAALENETVRDIAATQKATVESDLSRRVFLNHNKLLNIYDGCIGVKTGFTKSAGRCLVGAAERDGVRLISVTLSAPNDWRDHERLLDLGFSMTENRLLAKKGDFEYTLPALGSGGKSVTASLSEDVRRVLLKSDGQVTADVRLSRYLATPLSEGQRVGEVVFTLDGKEIARETLTVKEAVKEEKKIGILWKIKNFFCK